MKVLDRKLVRELWKQRGQVLSIAAVVAVGIMTVLTLRGTYESLSASRAAYYRQARFPDAWARLERAPESLRRRIERLPGVAAVETRVQLTATLDVPGLEAPALGQFLSIPEQRRSMLADLHLESGRYLAPGRRDEVIVSANFAIANGFQPGDRLRALINGRSRELEIVGTAISPEYVYAVPPGGLYPDDARYGIVWMSRRALGPAYDMEGAFNEVMVTFAPGADPDAVMARLDRLLAPFGGLGAFGREDQVSHQILDSELKSNRTTGTVIPVVFLLVAAFLLNIVLGRMIATQRTEIAVLKAFGYSGLEVGWHYLRFALAAVLIGTLAGVVLGYWLGRQMVALYADFFDFPQLRFVLHWQLVVLAGGLSALAAAAGALAAVRRAVMLPPAEAMRPEPPASFRPGPFERLGLGRWLPAAGRMILRNVERTPLRSLLSAVGVAFAVAILVIGLFMFDGVERMMDLQFHVAQREDLSLTFNRPLSQRVRHELEHLAGVTRVEPNRTVPVRLHAGHRQEATAITGVRPGARLRRIVDADGQIQRLPPEGLVMSALLADRLGVATGDTVTVEVLEGERRRARVVVAGVVEDFMGLSVTMDLDALDRLVRGGRALTGAYLAVDRHERSRLYRRLKRLPVVAGVASPDQMLASFEEQLQEGLFISIFFMLGFSAVIAVAVVYNGARVALSERGRELASLRVLGFTRREVAVLLLGEQALVTLLAIPLGWVLGYALAAAIAAGLQTESYRIPLVVSTRTFLTAGGLTVLSAALSGAIVRRRLNRLDLIAVLKTRE
jgi:putative ABC transport system permease protein